MYALEAMLLDKERGGRGLASADAWDSQYQGRIFEDLLASAQSDEHGL